MWNVGSIFIFSFLAFLMLILHPIDAYNPDSEDNSLYDSVRPVLLVDVNDPRSYYLGYAKRALSEYKPSELIRALEKKGRPGSPLRFGRRSLGARRPPSMEDDY